MEFKLVGCCYHRGYPASHSALPLLPFLMGHQNYSQSQVMNQVRILLQILISPFFPHFWMYARYPSTHFGIKTGTRRSFEGQVRLIILALKLNPEVSVSWYIIKWFNRFLLGLCFTFSPPLSQPHALSAYFAYILALLEYLCELIQLASLVFLCHVGWICTLEGLMDASGNPRQGQGGCVVGRGEAEVEATLLVLSGCFWNKNPSGKEWETTSSGWALLC